MRVDIPFAQTSLWRSMNIDENDWNYWLSCYLDNELSMEDKFAVEQRILRDTNLREELDMMKHVTQCLERVLDKYCVQVSPTSGD